LSNRNATAEKCWESSEKRGKRGNAGAGSGNAFPLRKRVTHAGRLEDSECRKELPTHGRSSPVSLILLRSVL
jgi:hypothetical protein